MVAPPIEVPDALLRLIFTLVLTPAALARCSLVCKDWHRILSSVDFCRRITRKICTLADSHKRYGGFVVQLECPDGQQLNIPLLEKTQDAASMFWQFSVPDGWYTFLQHFDYTYDDDTVVRFGIDDALSEWPIMVAKVDCVGTILDVDQNDEANWCIKAVCDVYNDITDDDIVGKLGGWVGESFDVHLNCHEHDKHLMTVRVSHEKKILCGMPLQIERKPFKSVVHRLARRVWDA